MLLLSHFSHVQPSQIHLMSSSSFLHWECYLCHIDYLWKWSYFWVLYSVPLAFLSNSGVTSSWPFLGNFSEPDTEKVLSKYLWNEYGLLLAFPVPLWELSCFSNSVRHIKVTSAVLSDSSLSVLSLLWKWPPNSLGLELVLTILKNSASRQ